MAVDIQRVYKRGPLSQYNLKQRILIRFADLMFFFLITLIGRTVRFKTEELRVIEDLEQSGKVPIYALWHDRIFASTYLMRGRGIVVITSQSLDGEYIARFLTRFGFGAARGSSTRGGVRAMVEMIRLVRSGLPVGFTVDGPRGPRYEVKPGPVILSKKTGNPILPFVIECEKFWTLRSWDRLQIPKPFTRAKFFGAEPIYVPETASEEDVESYRNHLQATLDRLVRAGRNWREKRSS